MPLSRRQVYRRRRIAVFGGLAVVLGVGFYLPVTLLAPLKPVDADILQYTAPVQAEPVVPLPAYGASGLGAVGFPGLLANSGSADPLPIASITKVVTALVVLDAKPISVDEEGPTVVFSAADEQFYRDQLALDGNVSAVRSGQSMSERDLLEVVLVGSANNYADSLVLWAFGSEAAYLDAARAWLVENGLDATTVTEGSGIEPSNTSTVEDLVALGKIAVADPVVSSIISAASTDVANLGVIENTNQLLGIDGIDGIKTGTLDEAGACLLFSADYPVGSSSVTIVGVVLGGPDHDTIDAAIRSLLAEARVGFHEVVLASTGDEFARFETAWGESAGAVAAETRSIVTWADTPVSVLVEVDPVRLAPAGTDVGVANFTVGDQNTRVRLELASAIEDPGAWWRLTHPAELF